MHDPVMFAVPFFLLLLIIEWAAARRLRTPKPIGHPQAPT